MNCNRLDANNVRPAKHRASVKHSLMHTSASPDSTTVRCAVDTEDALSPWPSTTVADDAVRSWSGSAAEVPLSTELLVDSMELDRGRLCVAARVGVVGDAASSVSCFASSTREGTGRGNNSSRFGTCDRVSLDNDNTSANCKSRTKLKRELSAHAFDLVCLAGGDDIFCSVSLTRFDCGAVEAPLDGSR